MYWLKNIIIRWLFKYDFDFVLLNENAKIPTRNYNNDAGYDLYCVRGINVLPGDKAMVSTGIAMKSKHISCWLYLVARSSTFLRYGLLVDSAVIDDGYTGELKIRVFNTTKKIVHIPPQARIGQAIPMPHLNIKLNRVRHLDTKNGERGSAGFGSSGK